MNLIDVMFGEYTIFVLYAYECFATNTAIIDDFTEVENISLSQQISLFPNPAQNEINLEIEGMINGDAQVVVMDIQGRERWRQRLAEGNNSIDVNLFAEGMYFFKIQVNDKFITKRVLVHK